MIPGIGGAIMSSEEGHACVLGLLHLRAQKTASLGEVDGADSVDNVAASGSSLTHFADGANDDSALIFDDELVLEPSSMIVTLFFRSASNSAKFGGNSNVALPAA